MKIKIAGTLNDVQQAAVNRAKAYHGKQPYKEFFADCVIWYKNDWAAIIPLVEFQHSPSIYPAPPYGEVIVRFATGPAPYLGSIPEYPPTSVTEQLTSAGNGTNEGEYRRTDTTTYGIYDPADVLQGSFTSVLVVYYFIAGDGTFTNYIEHADAFAAPATVFGYTGTTPVVSPATPAWQTFSGRIDYYGYGVYPQTAAGYHFGEVAPSKESISTFPRTEIVRLDVESVETVLASEVQFIEDGHTRYTAATTFWSGGDVLMFDLHEGTHAYDHTLTAVFSEGDISPQNLVPPTAPSGYDASEWAAYWRSEQDALQSRRDSWFMQAHTSTILALAVGATLDSSVADALKTAYAGTHDEDPAGTQAPNGAHAQMILFGPRDRGVFGDWYTTSGAATAIHVYTAVGCIYNQDSDKFVITSLTYPNDANGVPVTPLLIDITIGAVPAGINMIVRFVFTPFLVDDEPVLNTDLELRPPKAGLPDARTPWQKLQYAIITAFR